MGRNALCAQVRVRACVYASACKQTESRVAADCKTGTKGHENFSSERVGEEVCKGTERGGGKRKGVKGKQY